MSAYYFIGNEKKRIQILELFQSNPDLETGQDLMFLMDGQPFKKLFNRFLPPVDKSWLIRVPKLDDRITLENLTKLPKYQDWPSLTHGNGLEKLKHINEDEANEPFDYDNYTQIRF